MGSDVAVRRKERSKLPVAYSLDRLQGNSFLPWANLNFPSSSCCSSYSPGLQSHQLQRTSSLFEASSLLEHKPKRTGLFIPSVRESSFYSAVDKPQAAWLPPLYGESATYFYKFHDIKIEPLTTIFKGRQFQLLLLRQILLQIGTIPFPDDLVSKQDDLEDSDDEELPGGKQATFGPLDIEERLWKCGWGILREIAVIVTKRTLSFWAAERLELRLAWKLTKDLQKSALRKAARGLGRLTASQRMFATAARGYFLLFASSWLVQLGVDSYRCSKIADLREATRTLAEKTKTSTLRGLVNLIATAIGVSVGTFLYPGRGTLVGSLAGPIAAEAVFPLLEDYLRSVSDGKAPDTAPA